MHLKRGVARAGSSSSPVDVRGARRGAVAKVTGAEDGPARPTLDSGLPPLPRILRRTVQWRETLRG